MKDATSPERAARDRAVVTFRSLGLKGTPDQYQKLAMLLELLLWRFLLVRWYEAHRFFESVESNECKELIDRGYASGCVWRFFSERQDTREFENAIMIGLSLLFAGMRKIAERGEDPKRASAFSLQRMMEVALEEIDDVHDLLRLGPFPPEWTAGDAPPPDEA